MSAILPWTEGKPASRTAEFEILTPQAEDFLRALDERFDARRIELLEARKNRQHEFDQGKFPRFLEETRSIREASWKVAPIPPDLLDRRVEITGPTDRKMVINALNSGASVFMADFEDANSPTWDNCIEGQINLRDAIRADHHVSLSPKASSTSWIANPAVLFVRPRGWHLVEKHFMIDGDRSPASLFDFGLYFFHNCASTARARNGSVLLSAQAGEPSRSAPVERRFSFSRSSTSGLPKGTIRATVLIETISRCVRDG